MFNEKPFWKLLQVSQENHWNRVLFSANILAYQPAAFTTNRVPFQVMSGEFCKTFLDTYLWYTFERLLLNIFQPKFYFIFYFVSVTKIIYWYSRLNCICTCKFVVLLNSYNLINWEKLFDRSQIMDYTVTRWLYLETFIFENNYFIVYNHTLQRKLTWSRFMGHFKFS